MELYKIHPRDNVALRGHDKIALSDIAAGEKVIKYGFPIGVAAQNIRAGEWVHTHNLVSDLENGGAAVPFRPFPKTERKNAGTFLGFRRKNGKAGIRNDIFILPTVGCVNGICERLARETGAIALTHPFGCSQLGGDLDATRKILCGLACHPNAGGVLVLSLGCENNTPESFASLLREAGADEARLRFLTVQNVQDEIEEGKKLLAELAAQAAKDVREEIPLCELVIGLKCGGSDALSGVTANPLVGKVCDRLVGCGGSAVLTEIPECFGAENILLGRCTDADVYGRLLHTIDAFKEYFRSHGERIDENPSPGNKAGGITTLAEKSLGCVQKGGTSAVVDVLGYGERVRRRGLSVLNGPGNDIVACTALAAAGAHMVLFTTGRGTPLGGAVPVIKIASNSELASAKPGWIDFDAGTLLGGDAGAEERLFSLVAAVASGSKTKSELSGCHEIAVWKNGITL